MSQAEYEAYVREVMGPIYMTDEAMARTLSRRSARRMIECEVEREPVWRYFRRVFRTLTWRRNLKRARRMIERAYGRDPAAR